MITRACSLDSVKVTCARGLLATMFDPPFFSVSKVKANSLPLFEGYCKPHPCGRNRISPNRLVYLGAQVLDCCGTDRMSSGLYGTPEFCICLQHGALPGRDHVSLMMTSMVEKSVVTMLVTTGPIGSLFMLWKKWGFWGLASMSRKFF